ncbi:hypothetical protein [Candidatus Poriferisodalis sp.]|uniref:hypothetical protein n=1 Tax=Candidatus Poriferisodalis sp. TaxID=3101277 RepID=UPI003B5AE6B8
MVAVELPLVLLGQLIRVGHRPNVGGGSPKKHNRSRAARQQHHPADPSCATHHRHSTTPGSGTQAAADGTKACGYVLMTRHE